MSLDEFTHICTLQFTNRDGETIDLDFANEEVALALTEYIKQNPPMNLESIGLVKNVYLVEHWENEQDEWDRSINLLKNPSQ